MCSTGPDDVDLAVTARDGNVYATRWDTLSATCTPLESIRLNLV